MEPTLQMLDNFYGALLNTSSAATFWATWLFWKGALGFARRFEVAGGVDIRQV